jgi:colicin import membrane protein
VNDDVVMNDCVDMNGFGFDDPAIQRSSDRQAAESAASELERVRAAADRQAELIRTDAAREREQLRQAHLGQIAALDDARAELRTRAERAESELARARTELDRARTDLATARQAK